MPPPSFFQALGLFVRPHVIDPARLAIVRDAVIDHAGSSAAIASATGDTVNLRVRNVDEVEIREDCSTTSNAASTLCTVCSKRTPAIRSPGHRRSASFVTASGEVTVRIAIAPR